MAELHTLVPNYVLEAWPQVGDDAVLLYLFLAYCEGVDEIPSFAFIADRTGMDEQRAVAALRILLKCNWIGVARDESL